jgi:hypothetical protein
MPDGSPSGFSTFSQNPDAPSHLLFLNMETHLSLKIDACPAIYTLPAYANYDK